LVSRGLAHAKKRQQIVRTGLGLGSDLGSPRFLRGELAYAGTSTGVADNKHSMRCPSVGDEYGDDAVPPVRHGFVISARWCCRLAARGEYGPQQRKAM
jgi:hypothetical protein